MITICLVRLVLRSGTSFWRRKTFTYSNKKQKDLNWGTPALKVDISSTTMSKLKKQTNECLVDVVVYIWLKSNQSNLFGLFCVWNWKDAMNWWSWFVNLLEKMERDEPDCKIAFIETANIAYPDKVISIILYKAQINTFWQSGEWF